MCVLKVRNDKSESELVASYLLGRTNKKRQPIVGSDEAPFKTKGADLSEMGEKFIRKFYISQRLAIFYNTFVLFSLFLSRSLCSSHCQNWKDVAIKE